MQTDNEAKSPNSAKRWIEALSDAEVADKPYHDVCDSIDNLYSDLESLSKVRADRQFQIFWANLEVKRPSIYSRPPTPVVASRFRDRKDLTRRAADLLERALVSDLEADDLHGKLIEARDDLCINARGVHWVRMVDRDGIEVPSVAHVDRKDFRHGSARKWEEVPWCARRTWPTREKFEERFGTKYEGVVFEKRDLGGSKDNGAKKAEVWEIWSKDDRMVYFVTPGCETVLDEMEPWLDLTGFFPCPKPAYGTLKRATLTPVPDFVYYRDQVEEINELTARIAALSEGLRLRGVYAAGSADLGAAIEKALMSMDNRAILVPLPSLIGLGAGGTIKDAILWFPIETIAAVIEQLIGLRQQLIQDVYEITGLSDIMRGATEASETATAQQLKSQYGSVRVREAQNEMVRLARDVIRLKAECMAEVMSITDLMTMAQVDDLPSGADLAKQAAPIEKQVEKLKADAIAAMEQAAQTGDDEAGMAAQQHAQEAMGPLQQQLQAIQATVTQEQIAELYKSQKLRPFALEVETDSTIYPDENAEKQRATEFLGAVGPMLQQGVMAMQTAPQLGPFVAESLRFVTARYRPGRQMDDAIDELAEGFANYQPPPQEQGDDPEAAQVMAQVMAQAEVMKAQAAGQLAQAKAQEAEGKVAVMQQQAEIKAREAETKGRETEAKIAEIAAKVELIAAQKDKVVTETGVAVAEAQIDAERAVADEDRAERGFEREREASERQLSLAERETEADIKARTAK